ncbi:MAG: hypothetical protein MZU97_19900 [Bacillus subtilis]|nr:hypothetical protein [Bacillus subtilis]
MIDHAKALGVEFLMDSVVRIDPIGPIKTIHTEQTVYQTKTIIIATGASPFLGRHRRGRIRRHAASRTARLATAHCIKGRPLRSSAAATSPSKMPSTWPGCARKSI